MARVINEKEFANIIQSNTESKSTRPLVVDCFTDWCPPCKVSAPVFESFSQKYHEADFVKINVDKNQGVAAKLQIRGVPTFVIIIGSKVVSKVVGADMRKLEREIKKTINGKD
ncbi:MAG: thioredoxin family protein [Candidatus Hodarchaeales archaeon]|jgi:thioredoxin 1